MSAVDIKYYDIDNVDQNCRIINDSEKALKEIIDLVPYIDEDGNEKYIDEVTRDEKIEEKKNKIYNMIHEIEKNNCLNQKSKNNSAFNNNSFNVSIIIHFNF